MAKDPLRITIDIDELAKQCNGMKEEIKKDFESNVQGLSRIIHANLGDLVEQNLHSTRNLYKKNILPVEDLGSNVFIISIVMTPEGDDARTGVGFIEEGMPVTDMKEKLLTGKKAQSRTVKATKNKPERTQTYSIVPYLHSKDPQDMPVSSTTARKIVSEIRAKMKKEGIPWRTTIEKNADGSPRVGKVDEHLKLHSFNWGGSIPGKGNTPAMSGLSIYQTLTKTGNVRRDIMTFRTVTNETAKDKWIHPGIEAKHFLEEAQKHGMDVWERDILPKIFARWE